jgi:hypothetical protein
MTNPHIGSSFDDFLEEEDLIEEVAERAIQEILAWQMLQVQVMEAATFDSGCDGPVPADEHQPPLDLN